MESASETYCEKVLGVGMAGFVLLVDLLQFRDDRDFLHASALRISRRKGATLGESALGSA